MKRIWPVLLLVWMGPAAVSAGTSASLDYGAAWVTPTDGRPAIPLQVSPGIGWKRAPFDLDLTGSIFAREGSLRPERWSARMGYTWSLSPAGKAALGVEARRDAPWNLAPATELRARARLSHDGGRTGAWIGADAIRIAEWDRNQFSLVDLGAWAKHKRLTLTTSFDQTLALLPKVSSEPNHQKQDSMVTVGAVGGQLSLLTRSVTVTNARLTFHWAEDRLELESNTGMSLSSHAKPQRWFEAAASYWISPGVAVCAKTRTRPEDVYRYEAPNRLQTSVFIRLHSLSLPERLASERSGKPPLEWSLDRLEGESARLRVVAPGAYRVEMRSDVTDWQPMALNRVEGEAWEVILSIAPGVHSIDLRIDDGPWAPPPGAPLQEDGFLGVVGQVIVQ
jgi:hypothetical protein